MSGRDQKLRLSGEDYKAIFNALPHPSYIWQKVGDDLILIEYNEAAEDITEGKVKILIGIKASEHYKERPKILEDLKHCLNKKTKISREIVHKLVTTGKERVFIRFYDFIEPDLVLVHTEDITKQKQAEESLKKEEQEKSMILGAVSDHIIYYDTEQNIIWANQAASDSLGLSNEEIIGRKCYELWQNRKEPSEICPVLRALETGKTQIDEVKTPDGRVWFISGFPVRDDNGNTIGMVEITRDITAQKYTEENLRRERDILGRITDTSPVGIAVVNKVGHIIFANPQAEKILGLTKDEITQRMYNAPSWKITDYDGNPFPDDELPLQKVKNTRESVFDVRHAIQWPNGQKRYLSINASPIFDENKNFDGMVATIEDITEKWMIEQKLRESEEKYRTLFENMHAAFALHEVIVDENNKPVDYKYIKANPAFEKMTGIKVNELIGKTVTEVLPGTENDPADWIGKFGNVGLTGVPLTVEDYSEQIDRWFNVSGYSPKKGYFAVTFHDITERKKAEQELKESEEKFRKIAEQSFMGIGIIQDNRVKYVNEAVAKILEYSLDEMMTWTKDFNITNTIHPEDLPRLRKQRELRRSGEFNLKPYISYRVISKSGKVKWIDQYSKNILYQGREAELITITDITEKKIAEQKLKESEEKYRDMAELLPDTIFEADLDMNLKYVNPAGYIMFGYSPQEVRYGLNIAQLLTSDSLSKAKKRINEISTGKSTSPNEYEMLKKDGSNIYCRIHSRPIIKNGKITGFRGTATDITDIKLAEQKLKEKNIELSVLNRIITLGNESQSLQEFLEKSYDQVLDIVDFDRGGIYLYDPETQHNILILHKNVHPDFIAAVEDVDISKGLFNTIFDKNKPFYIEDFSVFMENSKELGVYSAAIIPLRSKDEYVGSLNIGSPVHQILSHNELELLVAIGKQMGIIIQKFESEQLLKESEEKHREAYNRINLYKDLFTHDINNIFQNILSSNELAMLYSNIPEKLQDYVEVANLIKEQVSRGAKLVSNIQKLSELEEFKKPLYSIEVCSVLNNVINSIKKNFLYKKIDISFHSLENQYLIKANELIFDVFENILINAVKHNRNPTIEIQIKISKNLIDNTNYVKIEFIDNGIGIADIMKDVIFQRDVKKEKAGGIGLGLLLIKRILENFNGTVKVEDKVLGDYSKGSNFIVLIPEA